MLIVGGGIASPRPRPRPRPHPWVAAPHLSGFQSSSLSWQVILTVMWIGHCLRSSKTPHFQNDAKRRTFLVKMSFTCMAIKIISLSNAEHLTSFWYRGPGELENALSNHSISPLSPAECSVSCGGWGEGTKKTRWGRWEEKSGREAPAFPLHPSHRASHDYFLTAHFRYIKILAGLWGFWNIFLRLHCLAISRRGLSTKKTKPNIGKWPGSLRVMLEFSYIERGLLLFLFSLEYPARASKEERAVSVWLLPEVCPTDGTCRNQHSPWYAKRSWNEAWILPEIVKTNILAPVLQTSYSSIHRINLCPVDKY